MITGERVLTCRVPGCDRPASRTGDTGACRVHVSAIRQRARGFVSVPDAAGILRVDRRVIEDLYEAGEIEGERPGGKWSTTWLERRSLAAYFWSRPRCDKPGCNRRVIGDGPGCSLHRRSGRHHSEETKRKMSQTQRTIRGTLLRAVQWHPCEREGCDNWTDRDHFCSNLCKWDCALDSLNREPDAEGRHQHGRPADVIRYIDWKLNLQEGNHEYRAEVECVKAERKLFGPDGVVERLLDAGIDRSVSAIFGYVRAGWLKPEPGFNWPQLFSGPAVDELIERLRGHPDGRLRRFNRLKWRGKWIKARHGMRFARRAWGRANAALAAAKGTVVGRPPGSGGVLTRELRQLITTRRAEGHSDRAIAREIHVGEATVRRFRPAS